MTSDDSITTLWLFPKPDFGAWKRLTSHDIDSYDTYRSMLNSTRSRLEREGKRVRVVTPTVAEFARKMEERKYWNTPYNRKLLLDDWR